MSLLITYPPPPHTHTHHTPSLPTPPPQGMPDYPPPSFVVDALVEATKKPSLHQYTRGMVSHMTYHMTCACHITLSYAISYELSHECHMILQGTIRLVNALGKLYSKLHGREIDPLTNVSVHKYDHVCNNNIVVEVSI